MLLLVENHILRDICFIKANFVPLTVQTFFLVFYYWLIFFLLSYTSYGLPQISHPPPIDLGMTKLLTAHNHQQQQHQHHSHNKNLISSNRGMNIESITNAINGLNLKVTNSVTKEFNLQTSTNTTSLNISPLKMSKPIETHSKTKVFFLYSKILNHISKSNFIPSPFYTTPYPPTQIIKNIVSHRFEKIWYLFGIKAEI